MGLQGASAHNPGHCPGAALGPPRRQGALARGGGRKRHRAPPPAAAAALRRRAREGPLRRSRARGGGGEGAGRAGAAPRLCLQPPEPRRQPPEPGRSGRQGQAPPDTPPRRRQAALRAEVPRRRAGGRPAAGRARARREVRGRRPGGPTRIVRRGAGPGRAAPRPVRAGRPLGQGPAVLCGLVRPVPAAHRPQLSARRRPVLEGTGRVRPGRLAWEAALLRGARWRPAERDRSRRVLTALRGLCPLGVSVCSYVEAGGTGKGKVRSGVWFRPVRQRLLSPSSSNAVPGDRINVQNCAGFNLSPQEWSRSSRAGRRGLCPGQGSAGGRAEGAW